MRIMLGVYALLYLVIEMIGYQLSSVGWREISPLLVATAVTDALLVVSILLAALLAFDLGRRRWQPAVHAWLHRHGASHDDWWDRPAPFEARSWRAEPLALPAGEH
jgi:hypothetical protein